MDLYVYSLRTIENDKTVLMYCKSKEAILDPNSPTICIQILDVPQQIVYLQHNLSNKVKDTVNPVSREQVIEFIPSLENLSQWKIQGPGREMNVAPIVSFEIQKQFPNKNEEEENKRFHRHQPQSMAPHGPDVPLQWNDLHPAYMLRQNKKAGFTSDNLMKSPLHRDGPMRIFATELHVYDNSLIKIPNTKESLAKPYRDMTYIKEKFKATEAFNCIWCSSIKPLEYLVSKLKLSGPSWIRCENLKKEPSRWSDCEIEFSVEMQNITMTQESKCDDIPYLNVYGVDMDFSKLVCTKSAWNGTEIKHIERMEVDIAHLLERKPVQKRSMNDQTGKLIPTNAVAKSEDELKLQAKVQNFFQDMNLLLVYKWNDKIEHVIRTLQLKLNRLSNYAIEKNNKFISADRDITSLLNTNGIIFVDSFAVFKHKELFVREQSQKLSTLARIHLPEIIQQQETLDAKTRLAIVFGLFNKMSLLNCLFELSATTYAPLHVISRLFISEFIEWLFIVEYVSAGFILRQPDKNHRRYRKQKLQLNPILTSHDLDALSGGKNNLKQHQYQEPLDLDDTKNDRLGGLILPARVGVHLMSGILDFRSQYPRILQALNACFSTLKISTLTNFQQMLASCEHLEPFESNNNNKEIKQARGIIASICDRLITQRQELQTAAESKEIEPNDKKILQVRAKVVKFVTNSIFGNLWNAGNLFFCSVLAEYVTAFGRCILEETAKLLQTPQYLDYQLEIIGGDTDSIFVKAGRELQIQLDHLMHPVQIVKDPLTFVNREIPGESKMNDPNVTQQQYDLLYKALESAANKISETICGMKCGVDEAALIMAIAHKRQYALIPLNKNISVQNCEWKGFTIDQMGIAKFVLDIRPHIMFDFMTLCHSSSNSIDSIQLNKASYGEGGNLFFDRLSVRLRNIVYAACNQQFTLSDFKIVNHVNKDLQMYHDDRSAPIPVQIRVARTLKYLWENEHSDLGEYIIKGDCVEYVMCHDFTVPENYAPVPYQLVETLKFKVHIEWYLMEHLVQNIYNLLSPFQIVSREEITTFICKVIEETREKVMLNV